MTKYVFITGGVVSSLGKGITAASLGTVLEARDFKVTLLKLDPYINVDPGTMSPMQHERFLLPKMGLKQTWISGTMNATFERQWGKGIILPLGKFTNG